MCGPHRPLVLCRALSVLMVDGSRTALENSRGADGLLSTWFEGQPTRPPSVQCTTVDLYSILPVQFWRTHGERTASSRPGLKVSQKICYWNLVRYTRLLQCTSCTVLWSDSRVTWCLELQSPFELQCSMFQPMLPCLFPLPVCMCCWCTLRLPVGSQAADRG